MYVRVFWKEKLMIRKSVGRDVETIIFSEKGKWDLVCKLRIGF